MATTSIWAVKGWLGSVILYTEDPDKTTNPDFFEWQGHSDEDLQGLSDVIAYAKRDDATCRQQLVTGVNCSADTAREEMMAVKARYGKLMALWPITVIRVLNQAKPLPAKLMRLA